MLLPIAVHSQFPYSCQGRHPCFKFFEDGHGKSQAHQEYK
jgi:hypothetical protein